MAKRERGGLQNRQSMIPKSGYRFSERSCADASRRLDTGLHLQFGELTVEATAAPAKRPVPSGM